MWNDLKFAGRQLRRNMGFSAIAVITLALGIGANTAIFSMINGILLCPLPYRDPDRLVTICDSNLKRGYPQMVVAPANLRDWITQGSFFEQLGGQIYTSLTLTGTERPEHLHAAWTTPNYFSAFGVKPLMGRTFLEDDKPPSGHRVVVLSHGLWERSFGADQNVLGKPITLSGLVYTVVGVMPQDFKIYRPAAVFGLPTGDVQPQLWAPYPGDMGERTNKYFLPFARLKPGVTLAQAQNEMKTIAARLRNEFPSQKDYEPNVQPLNEQIIGGSRQALQVLLAVVGFVLLIACANVANLSLARSASRAKEFAIRSALGAGHWQLARQMLVESTLLAVIGGIFGVLLAHWGVSGLIALHPANIPRVDEIRLDASVLGFTLVLSLVTAVIVGFAPAMRASNPNPNESLKESGGGSGARHRQVDRSILVVAEVALALILLVGAGLMIKSFARLIRVDPGFTPEQLMSFDFSPAGRNYAEDAKRISLVKRLRERLQAQPGVKSVATVYGLPFGTMLNSLVTVFIEPRSTSAPEERVSAGWRVVSPGYFGTMEIPFLNGRPFSEGLDFKDSAPVAIINEAFQRKYFPGEEAVGRRIKPSTISTNWHEIVGVIKDVKLTGLDTAAPPEVYQSDSQNAVWMFSLVVRASLPSRQVEKMVREEVAAVDKELPLFNVRTLDQALSDSVAPRRFTMALIGLFAALALTLTTVGIYGLVSYSVSQRTREIGVRMALGASRRAVVGLMLRQAMTLVLIGIEIGLIGSFALARLIASQLFGVSTHDPATIVTVGALLVFVTLAACYLPARRATKIDPMAALRYE